MVERFQKVMTSQEHQTIITLSFILNSKKATKFAVKICNGYWKNFYC